MHSRILKPLAAVAVTGSMLFGMAGPAFAAPAVQPAAASSVQRAAVTGVIDQVMENGNTFTGAFTPTGFAKSNGALAVTGQLTGTVTDAAGTVLGQVNETVTTTVAAAATQNGCDILNLVLGPIHLDLLGLVIDLNQVQLDITAVPGAGNLLGNLLCAVAGLLDGSGLSGLANILNRLLGL